MKISVVSGGFDPIHSGHIEYFKAAKHQKMILRDIHRYIIKMHDPSSSNHWLNKFNDNI